MTIAMCYVAPEGVVLGADSTTSATSGAGHFHFFNHNQKLFEIGEGSPLGLLTWGLGGLPGVSYRTLAARLGDDLSSAPAASVEDVAKRWAALVWGSYSSSLSSELSRAQALNAKTPYNPAAAPPASNARTEAEEKEFNELLGNNFVGFCVAGYCLPDRNPRAFSVEFLPTQTAAPPAVPVTNGMGFWGAPNFIIRSIVGFDMRLLDDIMRSGHWKGTDGELLNVLSKYNLNVPGNLPIRDAIDFVHSSIHSTIKALKFSNLNQICGGPIEISVITTDRKFRWVRHKEWHAAIAEGEGHDKGR